jgi:hypothetical protein
MGFSSVARIPVPNTTAHQKNLDGISCEIWRRRERSRQLEVGRFDGRLGWETLKDFKRLGNVEIPRAKWTGGVRTIPGLETQVRILKRGLKCLWCWQL